MAQRRSGLSSTLCLALAVMAAICAASTAQQQPAAVPVPSVPVPPAVPLPGVPVQPAVPVPSVPMPPAVPVPSMPMPPAVPVPSSPMPPVMPVPSMPMPPAVPMPSVPVPSAVPVPSGPVPSAVPVPRVPVPTGPSCPPVQASLSPCISYFIGNSSSPSDACCTQMRSMFQLQAPCLCAAIAAVPSQLGSVIGQVLPSPSACNLPPNACSAETGTSSTAPSSGTPTDAAAPVASPAGTNPAAPASGGGVKKNPEMAYSAAVAADFNAISAAVVLAIGASFLAARVF